MDKFIFSLNFGIDYVKTNLLLNAFRDRGYFKGEDISARIDDAADKAVFRIENISSDTADFFEEVLDIACDGKVTWMYGKGLEGDI